MATCCVTKDREEARNYAVEFSAALDDGDSLSGNPTVEITRRKRSGAYEDKSSEFGALNAVISGTQVQFQIGVGDPVDIGPPVVAATQAPDRYFIRVSVDTAQGEILIETVELEVTAEGDTDAP